jgi:flagellar protein FliS
MTNPIQQYKEQAISTMSPGEQLVVLFDEALKNLHYGSMMLKNENFVTSRKCTLKCKNIFSYLSAILDHKYNVSENLDELYLFFIQQVEKAEAKQDPALLDELVPLVEEMRDTWVQADKLSHMNK